jgi:WD40 repeat protein
MDRGALAGVVAAMAAIAACGASANQPGPLGPAPPATSWRACDTLAASIVDLAYSSDGRWLAAAGIDGSVTVAELSAAGSRRIRLDGRPVRVALTEDGSVLVAASEGQVALHSLADGRMARQLAGGAGDPLTLKLSDAPSPLLLAAFDPAAAVGDNLKIWRLSDGVLVGSLSGSPRASFTHADEAVVLVDEARGFEVVSFGGRVLRRTSFSRPIAQVAFAPDGAYLGGVLREESGAEHVAIMSVSDDSFLWISSEPNRATQRLLFLENPSRVVQLGERVLVLDQVDGSVLAELPALAGAALAVPSPDGETVAAFGANGLLRLVSTGGGGERSGPAGLFGLVGAPRGLSASPQGDRIAVMGPSHTWVVDVGDGRLLAAFETALRPRAAFSPDGTRIALGGRTRTIHRIEGGAGELEIPIAPEDLPCAPSLVFSPDGRYLASGGCGRVELFRRDGASVARLPSRAAAPAVAFSPEGDLLATSGPELWRIDGLTPVWPPSIAGPAQTASGLSGEDRIIFSADGRRLLVTWAAGSDAETALLDAADGSLVRTLDASLGPHPGLSLDGGWLSGTGGVLHLATLTHAPLDPSSSLTLFLPDSKIVGAGEAPLLRVHCPDR